MNQAIKSRLQSYTPKKAVFLVLRILLYVLLIDMVLVFLYPFFYMFVTSFKSYNDINNPIVKWIPHEFSPENWKNAFVALNYLQTFFNSAFVTLISTAAHIFVCSYVAYGFSRYRFPGKNILFMILIFTIIVPSQAIIVPSYMINSQLGFLGTYLPLLLPTFVGMGLRGGLFIFLYRQYYIKLPRVLEEAAYIDGCGPFKTYFKIAFPTAGATTLVCAVLSIVWHWNDFFEPSIYISTYDKMLLPQMLPQMLAYLESLQANTVGSAEMMQLKEMYHNGVAMAGVAMAVTPLLIMYFFLQGKFMQGIERTGLVE